MTASVLLRLRLTAEHRMSNHCLAARASIAIPLVVGLASVCAAQGATLHVWSQSPVNGPGTAWTNAYQSIQDAVDSAQPGDTVLVTNGVYASTTRAAPGTALRNRVCVTNAITVQSINGPAFTTIAGVADPATTNGPDAVRCAYLSGGAVLRGFTLTNGHTLAVFNNALGDLMGGGAYLDPGGLLESCLVSGNDAYYEGGGLSCNGGICSNSVIRHNRAMQFGGALVSAGGRLVNCLIHGNEALNSGGGIGLLGGAMLVNCTVVDNKAVFRGGGMDASYGWGAVVNTIVYGNWADNGELDVYQPETLSCTNSCAPGITGVGCTEASPLFIDSSAGNYRLQSQSPCVDAGINGLAGTRDQEGYTRRIGGAVDMGAYEFQRLIAFTTRDEEVSAEVEERSLWGTAAPAVGTVVWSNRLTGASGIVAGPATWTIPGVALGFGRNKIIAQGLNAARMEAWDAVTITRTRVHSDPSPAHYVRQSGSDEWPYTNWLTAARHIQDAVDAAGDGDAVLVDSGTYNAGGKTAGDGLPCNRVCVTRPIAIRGINGPGATTIEGAPDPGGGDGPDAVRGVYLVPGASLSGFTVTAGHTMSAGDTYAHCSAGGILLDGGGVVSNCVVTANSASFVGGGITANGGGRVVDTIIQNNTAYNAAGMAVNDSGSLDRCVVRDNVAPGWSGGIHLSGTGLVSNCAIYRNRSQHGGGVYLSRGGTVRHTTVCHNQAWYGGGLYCSHGGRVHHTVSYHNAADYGGDDWWNNGEGGTYSNSCASGISGPGCIDTDPLFIDSVHADYRLRRRSPCRDAGSSTAAGPDLDGYERIVNGACDIGAYEFHDVVQVTSSNETFGSAIDDRTVIGTSAAVGTLTWTNTLHGSGGTIPATPTWTLLNVPLAFGLNVIVVSGTNSVGTRGRDAVTITRMSWHDGNSPVHYVSPYGLAEWPYTDWSTAAKTIQAAVDAAADGDSVLVTNGVYASGGATGGASVLSNRVFIGRGLHVSSVNGPSVTTIVGAADPFSTNGPAAVRCAYIVSNAVLCGFTLTNGHTLASGDESLDRGGAGVLLYRGGTVLNCVIAGCRAAGNGGGALCYEGGEIHNACIVDNRAVRSGGGVHCGNGSRLLNSTVCRNWADWRGGGVHCDTGALARNCILWSNENTDGRHGDWSPYYAYFEYCRGQGLTRQGCIPDAPQMFDPEQGDYRLRYGSPCIDSGLDLAAVVTNDLSGSARPLDGNQDGTNAFDLGCYEYDATEVDTDGDGMADGDELIADTSPANENSVLRFMQLSLTNGALEFVWQGGTGAVQYLEYRSKLLPSEPQWTPLLTNMPPTPLTTNFLHEAGNTGSRVYRLRAVRP